MLGETLLTGPVVFLVMLFILGLIYLFMQLITAWARRRVVERIVISIIGAVVRQNLPLAAGISVAAESEVGRIRLHLQRVASLLSQGVLLSQALRFGFPDCSGPVLSLVIAGERAGQLPRALAEAERWLVERPHRRRQADLPVWVYLSIMLAFVLLLVTGVMVMIAPKITAIYADYKLQLPAVTQTFFSIGRVMIEYSLVLILLMVLPPIALYLSFRPRRADRLGWTSRAADWIRWHTPGVRQIEFGRGMQCALDTARLAVRSGMDLSAAFELAADIDVNVELRQRLRRFSELLAHGHEASRAARETQLGEVVAVALASAQRTGDMDAALRYAADYHRTILSRWWYFLSSLAWPLATFVLSGAMGGIALAIFMALIGLIDNAVALVPL
jgi:type II secretory pathway component PulF